MPEMSENVKMILRDRLSKYQHAAETTRKQIETAESQLQELRKELAYETQICDEIQDCLAE